MCTLPEKYTFGFIARGGLLLGEDCYRCAEGMSCERGWAILLLMGTGNAARYLGQSLTNKTFTIRLITELWRTPLMAPLDKISSAWQYHFKLSMPCLINIMNQGVEDESCTRLWNTSK